MINKINVFDEFVRQGVFYGLIYGVDNPPAANTKRFCFFTNIIDLWTPANPLIVMKLIMLGYEIAKSPLSDDSFDTHLSMLNSKCNTNALTSLYVVRWEDRWDGNAPLINLRSWLAQELVKINMTKFEAADFHKYILLTNSKKC